MAAPLGHPWPAGHLGACPAEMPKMREQFSAAFGIFSRRREKGKASSLARRVRDRRILINRDTPLEPAPDRYRIDDLLDAFGLARAFLDESPLHIRVDDAVQIDRVIDRLHLDIPGRDRLVLV